MSEERNAKNGKDGAAESMLETNRSKGEEGVESIRLEEQSTGYMDTGKSDVPEKVPEAARMIVRFGDSAGE